MVVGLSVAITASGHAMISAGEIAPVIAVAYRRPDVVTVSVVVTVVLVMVVVVVIDRLETMVMMVPRIIVRPVIVRTIPAPAVVESVVIPIG